MKLIFILASLFVGSALLGGRALTELPSFDLGKNAKLDGSSWSTDSIGPRVAFIAYVDPDHKNKNKILTDRLSKIFYSPDVYIPIAIINMDATSIPNFILNSKIKSEQKANPLVIYLRDYDKQLVKNWGFDDDEYVVSVFDSTGQLLFYKAGELSPAEVEKVILIIDTAVNRAKTKLKMQ